MKIYIIGMMGSGKSTVGKKLAKRLNFKFYDLDNLIEEETNMSISNYFSKFGEDSFRKIEHKILCKTLNFDNSVIATGGGAACFSNNIHEINQHGISVYLDANTKLIMSRLNFKEQQKRPLLCGCNKTLTTALCKQKYLETLLLERKSYYEQAHIKISALNVDINSLKQKIQTHIKSCKAEF